MDVLLELLAWQSQRIDELEQEILKLKNETLKPIISAIQMDKQGEVESWWEGIEKGRIEGILEGEEAGKLKEKLTIARNLLSTGIDIETIAMATGPTKQDITQLRNNELIKTIP